MLEKCISLIRVMWLFVSRARSTTGAESSKDASTAVGIGETGLADSKSVRPIWALVRAAGAVSLADLWQSAELVDLADWSVSLVDME